MADATQSHVGQMVLYWETDTECSPAVVQKVHSGFPGIVDLVVFRASPEASAPPCRSVLAVSGSGDEPAWGSWTPLSVAAPQPTMTKEME